VLEWDQLALRNLRRPIRWNSVELGQAMNCHPNRISVPLGKLSVPGVFGEC
jgi:hypothetical protein